MVKIEEVEHVILGAGLAGLSAASGTRNTVLLESQGRPGGLARTENIGGFWFDHVQHLLTFPDRPTELFIRNFLGDVLQPCRPVVWAHTTEGRTQYPIQSHLNGLSQEAVLRCVLEMAEIKYTRRPGTPANLEEALERAYGRSLCELFPLPYNRKLWRRPLTEILPTGHEEAVTAPDFEDVLRGVIQSSTPLEEILDTAPTGWYPRPPREAKQRGMEVVSEALAGTVRDLRLNHTVTEIDLRQRIVTCRNYGRDVKFRFLRQLVNTLPLPHFVRLCARDLPEDLRRGASALRYNRVISVMFRVRGPRPHDCGHYAYFADEDLIFNRLTFMHQFDPDSAPLAGWGLMAEITEAADSSIDSPEDVVVRCQNDIERAGVLPHGCEIVDQESRVIGPAYVVASAESIDMATRFHRFLHSNGVESLGRYGRWEASSMGEVIRDGRQWASRTEQRLARTTGIGMKAG